LNPLKYTATLLFGTLQSLYIAWGLWKETQRHPISCKKGLKQNGLTQFIASAIAMHILNHAKKSLKLNSKKEPDNIAVEVPLHLMSAHRRVYIWEDRKKCLCLCNTMSMRYAEVRRR